MQSQTRKIDIKKLYTDHASSLISFLTRKYENYDLAEDVIQTTFTRISTNENTLSNVKNIPGYLYKMAENLIVDHFRHKVVEDRYFEFKLDSQRDQLNYGSPEDVVEAQKQLIKLQQTIKSLPFNSRQAFLYHRIHGLSYKEIAERMGVSVSSVEKYMLHALRACREVLYK